MPSVAAMHEHIRRICIDTTIDFMAQVMLCAGWHSLCLVLLLPDIRGAQMQITAGISVEAILASGDYVVHNENSRRFRGNMHTHC